MFVVKKTYANVTSNATSTIITYDTYTDKLVKS